MIFLHLYQNENCKLQMGGSDQWGNITTGTELIRRKAQGEAFAVTAPLVTKADGSKFGKSEGGNIWLDPNKTPVFTFYQFWLNIGDEDAIKFIKIYSLKSREEIQALIDEHQGQEYLRILQKALAEELTERVHGSQALELAQKATTVFFGNGKEEDLRALDEATLAASLEGMNTFQVSRTLVDKGIPVMDLIATESTIFPSKGEARKMINGNGFSLNKTKCTDPELTVTSEYVLHNRYIIAQKGKKNYFVIELN